MQITKEITSADGLSNDDIAMVAQLVDTWARHLPTNVLRDSYYNGDMGVKDLGVSVSPEFRKKLNPRIDWAAKCVNWWADHVQFEGFSCTDKSIEASLNAIGRLNDIDNLMRKVVQSSLRHSVAFITVTKGNIAAGENSVIVSGYPATSAAALYSQALKRIKAGLVVVDSALNKSTRKQEPTLIYVFDDTRVIVLTRIQGKWLADVSEHGLGRVPMEHIAYHSTLERPFGSSRISHTVMSLVDDAQRELMNMAACASFAAAPQKYLAGANDDTARALAKTPYGSYIGSLLIATTNEEGSTPQYGQLPQLQMQPHTDYMRMLASLFSDATNVPLSSLGFSSTNPTSADAILASQEDAIVDISNYICACKRALANVGALIMATRDGKPYADAVRDSAIAALFANPSTPSPVSMSDAVQKRIAAFPWMADSDIPLRDLGYKDDELEQLKQDRKKAQGAQLVQASLQSMQDRTAR